MLRGWIESFGAYDGPRTNVFNQDVNGVSLKDGISLGEDAALKAAIDFLGQGYKDLGNGRFVADDGLRQVRMGDGDIMGLHGGGKHINFECLKPHAQKEGKFVIETNIHIFLK